MGRQRLEPIRWVVEGWRGVPTVQAARLARVVPDLDPL